MKVYGVEDPYRKHGIWRDFDGTVNPVFKYLSDGKCKDMPMENSDFYREGGKNWFSATDTPEKLKAWFSTQDVIEMEDMGYSVIEFEEIKYRDNLKNEYCRNNHIKLKRIPYTKIKDIKIDNLLDSTWDI